MHSDQPGAKIHRRAIDKERRQTEAIIDKAQRKALKRRKKEEREGMKRKKAAKSSGKGSRGPYYKKPKSQPEGDGSRKRHTHSEESKKDKKRRKKQEGSATKSGGSRRSRDESDVDSDDSDDSDDDAGREARLKAKREAKREREARREAKRAAAAAGKSLGSKNKKDVPKEQLSDEEGEEAGGGGAGTPGGDGSSKDKGAGASSEGGEKQKEVEDNVEREIMEIVGAYSNPEARSKLLAQLREHARRDARLQQEKKGTAVPESGDEPNTERDADADAQVAGERSDVAVGDKTEKTSPAEANTEQALKDTPLHDEKNGTAVSGQGEEPTAKAKKYAGAEKVSGKQSDAAMGDKAEKVSPAEASTERAAQDAREHQEKPRAAVPEPDDEPMAKKDDEVKVLGQQSDVAGGDKTEKASPAEVSADHRESPEAEGGQEDEVGRKRHEKGKKKDKPARGEQRRSPRTSSEGRPATFFGGSGGGRSSPRLSGEGQAASFGGGGVGGGGRSSPRLSKEGHAASFGRDGGGTGAGKKKRRADSPSSAGGSKRIFSGAGREDDDNRRQSSRAASAAATAALTGSS